MIEIENLTKTYQGVYALDNVSFTANKGHVVGFLGANGAGKTTTMDIICGCIGSDQGTVKICGHDILDESIKAKSKIGYVPDVPPLYKDMTVKESILYSAKLNQVKKSSQQERLKYCADLLDLDSVLHKLVGSLSKGYRQRVALAHALVHDPEVLVLDEPTEGLDPNQIAQMRETILSLKEEKTIILSSHILQEVENICDQFVIINKGKIVSTGSFADIVSQYKGNSFVLEIAKKDQVQEVIDVLSKKDYAHDVSSNDKSEVLFGLAKGDRLDEVAKLVIDHGWGLLKLSPSSSSLEGIFQKATSAPSASNTTTETADS